MPGSYGQFCPIARSLEILGDRWTLLVLRDLSMGRRRFTDLRASLTGIPPNVLSQRLKRLTEAGLVRSEELPPPAARNVYALTTRGRDVIPILQTLVRFGMPELPKAGPDDDVRADTVAHGLFLAWFDRAAAREHRVDEHYDLVVHDGDVTRTYHLTSSRPGLRREVHEPAAVTVEGPAWAFARLRQGDTLDDLVADGHLTVSGSAAGRARFAAIYALIPTETRATTVTR
ncbi:MAG TPA: helix-turn-helix domain-containing protein [Acidimicrobiales bacterium]